MNFIESEVCILAHFAEDRGIGPTRLLQVTRKVIQENRRCRRKGLASSAEGLAHLLTAEGGCVNVDVARTLLRRTKPASRRRVDELIREGELIGYPIGNGEHRVPVWQFTPTGGVIRGIPAVVAELKKSQTYEAITPFAFLLQADVLTDGEIPLTLLRKGRTKKVLSAAANYAT